MEPAGAERDGREPRRGELGWSRANQSNQPVERMRRCPPKPHLEERRGRESNPRIAVLQTATLPLGYPAVFARADNIVVAALVSSADRRHIDVRRGERLYDSAVSTL